VRAFLNQISVKYILATKAYMTQIFDDKGVVHPATVLSLSPVVVTQIKSVETDGYNAVQVGFGEKKEKRMHKAQLPKGLFRHFREYRLEKDGIADVNVGDAIVAGSAFAPGDIVSVSGISKGKGFQGGVKRHGFHGGPRTHGQAHSEREVGSIGGGGRAGGRVSKGIRGPGHMGAERVTVKNLKVLVVDTEKNELILEGAVPGRRGTLIEVRGKNAIKK
jgi:large subunit ribosomal protein L3